MIFAAERGGEKPRDNGVAKAEQAEVEGYKMEKMENADDSIKVSSSGIEWLAGLVMLAIIALAALGMRRGERRG